MQRLAWTGVPGYKISVLSFVVVRLKTLRSRIGPRITASGPREPKMNTTSAQGVLRKRGILPLQQKEPLGAVNETPNHLRFIMAGMEIARGKLFEEMI